jgi:hypothetical protein
VNDKQILITGATNGIGLADSLEKIMQTPLDTDFEGMSTNRAAYCASLERPQFRGRCALAREVLERHQRLGAHTRVVVVEQFAQLRHGDLDPIHPSGSPSPPRAIQNKLLIAISESRKSRRNSVHYPVNAGYLLRLDHAARLLHRRASLGTGQPLSEIAYACGFRDYTHFARKFRQRFGYSPGVRSAGYGRAGDGIVRASTGSSALLAHDIPPRAT